MTNLQRHTQGNDTTLKHARILHDLGRSEELLALLMPMIDSTYNPGMEYALCVDALIDLDRRQEAVKLARQGVGRYPDNPVMYRVCARALTWVLEDKQALDAVDRALALEPAYFDAHGTRAFVLNRLGRNQEALESVRMALELMPNSSDCLLLLAKIEFSLGNKENACCIVDDVLAETPTSAEALALKAFVTNGVEQKAGLLRQALRFAPNNSQYAQQYALYTTHLQRDAFLIACLPLLVILLYASRFHPVTAWLLDHYLLLALAAGFILIKPTSEHAFKYMVAIFVSQVLLSSLYGPLSMGPRSGFIGRFTAILLWLFIFATISFVGTLLIVRVKESIRERINIFLARSDSRRYHLSRIRVVRETAHCAVMATMPLLILWSIDHPPIPYLLYILATLPLVVYSATGTSWRGCINASWSYAFLSLCATVVAGLMTFRWPDMVVGSYVLLFLLAFLLAQWQINRLKCRGGGEMLG